jgi:hypothetical protein
MVAMGRPGPAAPQGRLPYTWGDAAPHNAGVLTTLYAMARPNPPYRHRHGHAGAGDGGLGLVQIATVGLHAVGLAPALAPF